MANKFLLLTEECDRHSDVVWRNLVGEFETPDEANEAIVQGALADQFPRAGDGSGTRFCRVDAGDYLEKDGKFYIQLGSGLWANYLTPERVRKVLEPY